ncbi:ribonuclease H-like domain-containing protein [Tanacetum coccineum]
MSFDDLYNNFKIVEQEVKITATSSTSSSSQNMAFVSSPSSINEVNTTNVQVSIANSLVSTDSTANLSDATIYAFLVNQPNGSQLVHEDLKQIHEDDVEEMDLKWQLALLSMRARRYYQRIGKKITINGSDTAGYEKSKVECFNCHKMGHFARECRSPRNQESRPRNHDNGNKNQDRSRRTVNVEETSSKAMLAIDGAGFDWSFMVEEEFNLATYKRGLASVEEQLVFYMKNEVMFSDQIVVLKRDASFKDSEVIALKSEIEKLKKEKDRKGVGYRAVPPPPTGLFAPLTIDLSNSSLEEFQQPKFKGYGPKASKSVCVDTSNEVKKTPDTPLVKELVLEKEKQTIFPTKIKFVKQQDKTTTKPVKVNYNYTTNRTHPNAQRNMVPRAVLMKTGLKPFNTARTVNTALPKSTVFSAKPMSRFSKSAQSTVKRPYQSKTVLTNKNFSQKVNTAKAQAVNTARPKAVNTARPKAVNTARPNSAVVNTVRANQANAVKALACWVWRPTKLDSASITLKKHNYIDARGRSKHVKRCWDTKIPQSSGPLVKVGDEVVHKELGDKMERAATTASSLKAEQDSGNINMTQSMATLNEPSP